MAETTYQNFDLSIESVGAGYRARVIASPAGEATEEITLPALDLVADTQPAQVAGGRLFTAVFRGEVLTGFRRSADKARQRGAGLRIRLRLSGVPELANLPWEHLYDATRGRFLALSNETQVVRYLDLPEPVRPLKVRAPLRILAVIASPADFPALDTEREWASLQAALADPLARSAVEVERLEPATLAALQRRLRRSNYHILHFMGHGAFDPQTQEGVLMLEDDARQGRPVSGQDVGTLLHDHRPLRLALLNACAGAVTAAGNPFGGVAQSLVQQGIPAVVAMRAAISDGAAQAFASEFYAAIADGYPVDAAVTEARKAISAQGNADEWGTPVLFMRAADGRLFDLAAEKVEEPAPAPREEPAPQPEVSGARGVYTQRARPALGGDSISHYHAGAATFGCLVQDRADPRRVYILCDYSGLSSGTSVSRAGDPVVQPGRYDGGNPAGDIVAAIARWATVRASPLAAADNVSATLAEVNDLADVSPHIRGRGFLKGVRAASSTARVYAVGRTAGQMQGTVVRVDAHTMVAWPRDQIVGPVQGTGDGSGLVLIPFDGLIECTPMLLPGDSGAVLVDGDNYALGLGFAGNDAASMFLPMQRVLDALNVDLVTEEIWRSLMQPAAQLARPPIAATLNSDVYISYHEADRAWVLGELMPWLESAGLTALVDVRDFDIAAPRLESIARAVETSRHTLAVLTPDYVAAEWEQLETLSARTADPAAQRRKLVPLKLKPCTLPSSIAAIGLGYADLTDAFASKYALPKLLKALGARQAATAQPPRPPQASSPSIPVSVQEVEMITNSPRSILHQNLVENFSEEELRTLCFDMEVDYENLPAQGKAGKARELIIYLKRLGRTAELIERCRELRPKISWEDTPGTSRSTVIDPPAVAPEQSPIPILKQPSRWIRK